jgi:CMP-N-acetylneuraminic acid synthetase
MARVLALIPARGGSKGVPRKNVRLLGGRPLIEWSIEAAREATAVDRVVVSTDDAEIAEVARAAGAEVPFERPAELAADDTRDLPVFQHALDELEALGDAFDVVVHLRPTSPLRPAPLVDDAVAALLATPADSLRSLTAADKTPYKMWRIADDRLQPLLGSWEQELFNEPRQALPPVYLHDGVIDVVRVPTLRAGSMCGRDVVPFLTPPGLAIDIDTEDDLERASGRLAALQDPGGR